MLRLLLGFAVVASSAHAAATNTTASWLAKRAALIHDVYGKGPGVLPTQSVPDKTLTWPEDTDPRSKGLQGLVWNISNGMFPITSTVFYSPASGDPTKRSKTAFMFHHGHSNCVCPMKKDDPVIVGAKCRPGCNSSMPSLAQPVDQYTWWDLYNVSTEFHAAGHDVFILSMPLKGINLGPGTTDKLLNSNHWWFLQWEQKGDAALRYFLEPAVLTANYAEANGYENIYMAGLSGGGWSTTFASAIDKRIDASFPIAGSTPCSMRNPLGIVNGQNWTGDDDEDFEQSCRPNTGGSAGGKGAAQPGRAAFSACNYTCQYLLAGLEPKRFQVQILHEYDTCCFSPHNRHDGMLQYESNIRQELQGGDRKPVSGHGWFTCASVNHSKHEVDAQSKTVIRNAMKMLATPPADQSWEKIPCDVMHQQLPANCEQDVEPGLAGDPYVPLCPNPAGPKAKPSHVPCTCTRPAPGDATGVFPCKGGEMPTAAAAGGVFSSTQSYFDSR